MKIVHILNTNSFSGAENVCISILKQLQNEKCYHTTYVSLNGPIKAIVEANGLEFYGINKMNTSSIKKMIKELKPDLIHCHDFTVSILTSLSTRTIPIISHLHNNPSWIKTINTKTILYSLTLKRYSYVLGVSQSIFDEFRFTSRIKKHKVISNPINLEDIKSNMHEKKYDLIFVGRLTEQKDPLRFINLIPQLYDRFPNLNVVILGDGDLRKKCENFIHTKNLDNKVHLLGFKENRFDFISASKLMCITSKWEGFGLMAIESLALGVPVLTTGVGGLKDIVTDKCGKICTYDNEFIEEAIDLLINHDKYMQKSEMALKRAKELENIDSYMNVLKNIYIKCTYKEKNI